MKGLLAGSRIVEQGTFITGPAAGMMLADLGADVIKIESPGTGDPYRNFNDGYYSPHFQAYNRNKRTLALDLKSAEHRATFHALIAHADVYIQNFRPGVADRIGADWETLHAINPALIYCSISGFGASGPYAKRPSYDTVTQSLSGFLGIATDPERPRLLGPAMADAITGLYAALGIAAALAEVARTGKGRHLAISMLEAMMHFAVEPFAAYFDLGTMPTALDRPKLAQAFICRCADGKLIGIHLSSLAKFWDNLVTALDDDALRKDERFTVRSNRIARYNELLAEMNRVFGAMPRSYWLVRLADYDLPYAPLNGIDEAAVDPQAEHLGVVVPVEGMIAGGDRAIRSPFWVDGECVRAVRAAPMLDQHSEAIRRALAEMPDRWPTSDTAALA